MSLIDQTVYNTTKKSQHGAGEMDWCKGKTLENNCDFIVLTAKDIVNEIIDNAIKIIVQNEKEEKINIQIVNNIIQNIYSKLSNNPYCADSNETIPLDNEIKKMIEEMKYPQSPNATGDQPEMFSAIEKKPALTNLIRGSKQFLSKFILNENVKSANINNCADDDEKLISIIELDYANETYKAPKFQNNENATFHLQNTDDGAMEVKTDKSIESAAESDVATQENVDKKKITKNSLGTRIMNFFRRGSKKSQASNSSD